jgi:hypothetical protein
VPQAQRCLPPGEKRVERLRGKPAPSPGRADEIRDVGLVAARAELDRTDRLAAGPLPERE